MANVINLNITPLYPIQTDAYTLSSPTSTPGRPTLAQPPKKRLRSCMSPARSRPTTPFEDRDLCSGFTSRSASYGSERSKSVRWEGEVPVTVCYLHLWVGSMTNQLVILWHLLSWRVWSNSLSRPLGRRTSMRPTPKRFEMHDTFISMFPRHRQDWP